MKDRKHKIIHIYLPFLWVAIGNIVLYGLFRWYYDFVSGTLIVREEILSFYIPIALALVSIVLLLRGRVIKLSYKRRGGDPHFALMFVMGIAIVAPSIICQKYIERVSFELTEVENAAEIREYEYEKYFRIDSYTVYKASSALH